MILMAAPVKARIEKDVITRITRVLKGKGSLQVQAGQEVIPSDLIGSSTVSAGFRTLNLAALLEVAPQDTEKYLARTLGQRIYKDELIAAKKGWFGGKKVITSPTDGILDFLNNKTGELKISFLPRKVDLPAGVFGIVEDVDHQRGKVIIRTQVNRLHGIVGSGKSRDGILSLLGEKDNLVSKADISPKFDGYVLAGGSLFFKDAISSAISAGVEGIITGGINAGDFKSMAGGRLVFPKRIDNDIGISVVACEGFGSIPLGRDIFEQLQQYEGKFVFIDGNKAVVNLPSALSASLTKIRNTRLPELEREHHSIELEAELKLGLQVRIVGNSYLGEQGRIVAVDRSQTMFASGVKDYLITVETLRRKIQVPVANIEIIV